MIIASVDITIASYYIIVASVDITISSVDITIASYYITITSGDMYFSFSRQQAVDNPHMISESAVRDN